MLPPKQVDCPIINPNVTNATVAKTTLKPLTTVRTQPGNLPTTTVEILNGNASSDNRTKPVKPKYNYSREYGRTVLTDVNSNIYDIEFEY